MTISRIIDTLTETGENKLYFWCNSLKNLKRPEAQVYSYLTAYSRVLDYVSDPDGLRIHIKGNRDLFPGDFRGVFEDLERETCSNQRFDLYYFMNYSTLDDFRRSAERDQDGIFDMESILMGMDEPDNVDLIIRTGGHNRLSGLIPMKSPNAELFFVPEYFPDLTPERILEGVEDCKSRIVNNGV